MTRLAAARLSEGDLRRELGEYHDRYPNLQDDELFVLWFLRAFVTDSDDSAVKALCGGPHDKGIDAVLIDESARIVFLVQGKYRKDLSAKTENRRDIMGFAQLGVDLCGDGKAFTSLAKDMAPDVHHRLDDARKRIGNRGYALHMYYVTLGKCSSPLQAEANRVARSAALPVAFQLFDGKRIMVLLADYFDGVAPPVPSLDLEMESGGTVQTTGIFTRYDTRTGIESWVFSMTDLAVAELFERAGSRLFARNVRGFLGNTEINRGMEATLAKQPEFFWYYNNGITIICDEGEHVSSRGQNILRVTNPQVINGQQTTRTLARTIGKGPRASILVRVIRVPRMSADGGNNFDALVSRIVSATNWQNAIRPSDLMSNDRRQIEIERQLRRQSYHYLRKRMTKGEARRVSGARHLRIIKKEEFAQAVAGCEFDPAIVREGKERLFEERWYTQIFPKTDPNYYLPRYWLMQKVGYVARGYPERAYAKWLVLNFMWSIVSSCCRTRAAAETFRHACERGNGDIVKLLLRAIEIVYREALRFYRGKRGTGQTAIDVSTFFQRRNLHRDFNKHWRGSLNKSRLGFQKICSMFAEALREGSGA
jgi:hypothetical protein